MIKYSDVKTYTEMSHYYVNVEWKDLYYHIHRDRDTESLELNPDFQRGHVWTLKQQIKYIEYKLSGGYGADIILTNCPGWMNDFRGPYQLVDGLQRITSILKFLDNKLKVFNNYYYRDFEGRIPSYLNVYWHVNNLNTRREVLKWYLELNSGGVIHTSEELDRVHKLLQKEIS